MHNQNTGVLLLFLYIYIYDFDQIAHSSHGSSADVLFRLIPLLSSVRQQQYLGNIFVENLTGSPNPEREREKKIVYLYLYLYISELMLFIASDDDDDVTLYRGDGVHKSCKGYPKIL